MNWYDELVTYEALGIEYDKVLNTHKVNRLQSAAYLFNPLVSNYENIVVAKENDTKLYDVKTTILDDGTIKLFGRVFGTVKPFVRILTKEEIEENYIIVNNSANEIKTMLARRSANKS